ncbi:Clp protease N-terminal domain-containing protein [Blastococcus mobilis]|uniref:Clp amino terminal domain-containing protein, pathogenicity island component n=1 Tax=Blastococcus mobilis TaxID=1938746 RepID=A0A238X2E2_9ACTN|nr:Clp protease N-terminal domain-containing protein [Blastococcus mobilis]SNR53067.1 Clp amino terminal domain-containing protein, pathogenicity island component [Blastococcus mobilis]
MFERFTHEARNVVIGAQVEARALRHPRIGTEHLLLSMLAHPGATTARALSGHGISHAAVVEAVRTLVTGDDLDADALGSLGIDLDAIRDKVEEAFGPGALDKRSEDRSVGARGPGGRRGGHIPFSPRAKKVLELSLREALAMKSRSITDGHILLGLIRDGEGLAMKVLHDRGVDLPALRAELRLALNP